MNTLAQLVSDYRNSAAALRRYRKRADFPFTSSPNRAESARVPDYLR